LNQDQIIAHKYQDFQRWSVGLEVLCMRLQKQHIVKFQICSEKFLIQESLNPMLRKLNLLDETLSEINIELEHRINDLDRKKDKQFDFLLGLLKGLQDNNIPQLMGKIVEIEKEFKSFKQRLEKKLPSSVQPQIEYHEPKSKPYGCR
jgi:hypothetical protein